MDAGELAKVCYSYCALKHQKDCPRPAPRARGFSFKSSNGGSILRTSISASRSSTSFRDSRAVRLTDHLSKALIHSDLRSPTLSVSKRRPSYRYLRTFFILLSGRNALTPSVSVFDLLVLLAIGLVSGTRIGSDRGNPSRTRADGEGEGARLAVLAALYSLGLKFDTGLTHPSAAFLLMEPQSGLLQHSNSAPPSLAGLLFGPRSPARGH